MASRRPMNPLAPATKTITDNLLGVQEGTAGGVSGQQGYERVETRGETSLDLGRLRQPAVRHHPGPVRPRGEWSRGRADQWSQPVGIWATRGLCSRRQPASYPGGLSRSPYDVHGLGPAPRTVVWT